MPIERKWIDKYLENGFVDIFRAKFPDKKDAYTWWSMRTAARQRNVGWRLDYFLITKNLMPYVSSIEILNQVFGSDHCPVLLEMKNDFKLLIS
jgi:exodeoxyribonuclease-3